MEDTSVPDNTDKGVGMCYTGGMKTEVLPRLNAEDKRLTGNILSAGNIKHKFAVRLQTVSRRASGEAANNIARFLGIHTNTVSGYVRRYNDGGIESPVCDKTRKPGKAPISVELKNEICRIACTEKPENGTHRGTRSLAKRFKASRGAASRILRERGIKPHLVKRFSFSNDPQFVQKLTDAAGLYMNPPDNAIVLCAGGKSRIQAPGRTAPVLPMLPHVPERQTVDYNGTARQRFLRRPAC